MDPRRFAWRSGSLPTAPLVDNWAPTLTARDPQIPNLPLETDAGGTTIWTHVASGGLVFGGAAVVNKLLHKIASGGLTFGGAAVVNKLLHLVASGGLTFGGAATVEWVPAAAAGADPAQMRDDRRRGYVTTLYGRG